MSVSFPAEIIERRIYFIRGQRVMLDSNLAELYGVRTKVLNQAVKRNKDRFPKDFMFQLSNSESNSWMKYKISRSQNVTLKRGQNIKYRPYAFSEHGILMLSSVLKSKRAVEVNITIMRTFVRLRRMLASNEFLSRKLKELEKKYDEQFQIVFDAIRQILTPPEKPKKPFGFVIEEPKAKYGLKTQTRRNDKILKSESSNY
ncbi:MAG: ORF6N domain-containing protein [Bacteroidota bacterium]